MSPERPDLASEWDRCAPWLQGALARDPTHSLDDVRALCESSPGRFQFWPGARGACVTQIIDQPQFRELHIWLAGGDLGELAESHACVEAFAKAAGCKRITSFVRPGLVRALAQLDYEPLYVAVAKELYP